jgi:hypothetical protein
MDMDYVSDTVAELDASLKAASILIAIIIELETEEL